MPGSGVVAARGCVGRRVPVGDPGWVRVVAARSAGFAGELRRVSTALAGCAGSPGWRGAAREQFAGSVSATVPQLGRVAARYDGYTEALAGYAGVLDRVQPRLVWLHRQLVNGLTEHDTALQHAAGTRIRTTIGAGAGSALLGDTSPYPEAQVLAGAPVGWGAEDDRQLGVWAAEFEQLWGDWDHALRRCTHALGQAGQIQADRHGWSALTHNTAHILRSIADPVVQFAHHPDLATLSAALGSLATDLTLLGTALLILFPPAAGACFTAATIISAAKLGTDTIRATHGDPEVGLDTLSSDAIAALPGGRALKATEDTAHTTTTLENLAEHQTSTTLVPGGGLTNHEAINGNPEKGHTLQRHVSLSVRSLRSRFTVRPATGRPSVGRSSSFYDRMTAENSISAVLKSAHVEIQTWLNGSDKSLILDGRAAEPVGITVAKGKNPVHVSGIKIVLRRDNPTWAGYRIHTAFPQP